MFKVEYVIKVFFFFSKSYEDSILFHEAIFEKK